MPTANKAAKDAGMKQPSTPSISQKTHKETLALMLTNFFRLPAAANRVNVDKNSATQSVVLIFEKAALSLFWNKATKIKQNYHYNATHFLEH